MDIDASGQPLEHDVYFHKVSFESVSFSMQCMS